MLKPIGDMTLICWATNPIHGDRLISRRRVAVSKKGRWLYASHLTFDPKTLLETKSSTYPGCRYKHRLEAIDA